MALSRSITRHHTAWIQAGEGRAVAVRYGTTDEEIICFGDGPLGAVEPGDRVGVAIHEIADGAPLESFDALAREAQPDELSLALVAEVHGNAPDPLPDGGNPYEAMRKARRFIALRPEGVVEAHEVAPGSAEG